jgi:hypothetical protein
MDRDPILSLTGPQLSEAVAQHVMRWRRIVQSEDMNRTGTVWEDAHKQWYLIPRRQLPKRDQGLFGIVAETWEPHRDRRCASAAGPSDCRYCPPGPSTESYYGALIGRCCRARVSASA